MRRVVVIDLPLVFAIVLASPVMPPDPGDDIHPGWGVAYASYRREGSGSGSSTRKRTRRTNVPDRNLNPQKPISTEHMRKQGTPQPFVMQATGSTTLELSDGAILRLIGVQVPEAWTGKAKALLDELCAAKTLTIEYGHPRLDSAQRRRVYAYLLNGELVNVELLKRGFAKVAPEPTFSKIDEFLLYERQARSAKRGLWAQGTPH